MPPSPTNTGDSALHVRFIEYMPFLDNQWSGGALVPLAEIRRRLTEFEPALAPADEDGRALAVGQAPPSHAISKTFTAPGWGGSVGVISSMTSAFCAGCSRLRLTADGSLKLCLFGTQEVSLRDAMRAGASDRHIAAIIRGALHTKAAKLGGFDSPEAIAEAATGRPMILIGG